MSLTLEDLRKTVPCLNADRETHGLVRDGEGCPNFACGGLGYTTPPVTESELIGLAVELLKAKGARIVGIGYDSAPEPYVWTEDSEPTDLEAGSYLVVPLSILGETP